MCAKVYSMFEDLALVVYSFIIFSFVQRSLPHLKIYLTD